MHLRRCDFTAPYPTGLTLHFVNQYLSLGMFNMKTDKTWLEPYDESFPLTRSSLPGCERAAFFRPTSAEGAPPPSDAATDRTG